MGSDKQIGSPRQLLETLKMGRVRTILTHTYPYPHEHSRHIMTAVIIACLFFISSDNMHTLIHKLDNNIKWWSMYVCLIGFFYFFSSPFLGRTIQPSYSNFNRWYVSTFRLLQKSMLWRFFFHWLEKLYVNCFNCYVHHSYSGIVQLQVCCLDLLCIPVPSS